MRTRNPRSSRFPASRSVFAASIAATLGIVGAIPPASAAIFSVGSAGAGCSHATYEAAFAAAAANAEPDQIRVGPDAPSTISAELEVENDTIELLAGLSSCTATTPTGGFSTLAPNATGIDAFWVHGTAPTELVVRNLHVVVGASGRRALRLEGQGTARFHNSLLADGQAPEGGNVWMSGPDVVLELHRTTVTLGNATTGEGGGIYCLLGGQIFADDFSSVSENTAFASGGGLFLDGCELDYLAGDYPPFYTGIYDNRALHGHGGGIYAKNSTLELRANHVDTSLVLSWNEAPEGSGGGLYISGTGATANLLNVGIQENVAGSAGGGIFVTSDAQFSMDIDSSGGCGADWTCSGLWFNSSLGSGSGGLGVTGGGSATLKRTSIYGNINVGAFAGAALGAAGSGSTLLVESSLIFENGPNVATGTESSRIFAGTSSTVTVAFSTILESTVASGVGVFEVANAAAVKLVASIVQPWIGTTTLTFAPADPPATLVDCVIVHESASLPPTATGFLAVTDPSTVFESLTGPSVFRPRLSSDAIDFCDTLNYTPTTTDIDGQVRGFDEAGVPDLFGPFDLGADERRPGLFVDGFEDGHFGRWGHT